MTYVPGFAWDIFISYSREHAPWVKRFGADLEAAINQRISSKDQPKIYLDTRTFEAGQHSREMLEAASKREKATKSEIIRKAVDQYLGIRMVSRAEVLEAFDKSRGILKGSGLKERIRKIRNLW